MARWAGGWRWTALLVVGVLVLVACEPPYFTGTGLDSRSATASEAVEVDPPEPVTLLRDCGLSVPLSDGGALWIFCDTTVPPATAPAVENSAAVAASANLAEPLDVLDGGGDPSQFITATSAWDDRCDPASADERRVRPLSASVFPYYWVDVVTVFFEHVCFSAGAEVGSGGIGVAQFFYDTTNPPTGALQATVLADYLWDGPTPTTAPGGGAPATEVMAGFGRVSGSDPVGFEVYVYRCQPDSVTGCQVGRVHAGSVASPAAYEWWDGTAFTAAIPDPGTAAMTVAGTSGSGEVTSIAWHPDMAKWVMSYLNWGPTPGHGSSVSLRVANNPTGRWSDPVTVTPAACAGDKCRDTYAHPALSSETSMAISYYSEPDAGGDGLVWTVDAEMFADGWIDVGPGDPDLDDLDRVKFWGIVAPNHPDYTFRPDDDTTRAEFAQMLWTVADKPATPPGSATFTDIGIGHPAFAAVEWLAATGQDATTPGGPWNPDAAIDRETVAVWLWNDAGQPTHTAPETFSDVPTAHPSFDPIMWAWQTGYIVETGPTTWNPTDPTPRRRTAIAALVVQDRTVLGTVTDDTTTAGINGVTVRLYDNTDTEIASAVTDNDGLYRIASAPVGSGYTVGFEHPDYIDEWHNNKPQATTPQSAADEIAVALDPNNRLDHPIDAALAAPSVTLDQPADGSIAFDVETLVASTQNPSPIDRVDFLVDSVVVASDNDGTDGWAAQWDTTAETDGDHTIEAVAISGGSYIGSPSSTATVDNTLDSPGRVQADLDAAKIDADTYVLKWTDAVLSPTDLEPRYQGPAGSTDAGTAELLAGYDEHWNDISTTTRAAVGDRHVRRADPAGAGLTQGDSPGPSNYPGCDLVNWFAGQVLATNGIWCTQTIRYSPATCSLAFDCDGTHTEVPDFTFYFTVGTGSSDVSDDENTDLGFAVPQYLIDAANSMWLAYETYDQMGYELPPGLLQDPFSLDVLISDWAEYAVPFCASCYGLGTNDYGVRISPTDAFATPRHESFHIVQFNYISAYDIFSEVWPGNIGRETTWWWLEATAEWADHQVVEDHDITAPEASPTEYASRLDDFADDPEKKLTEFKLFGDQKRQYGSFIFAEFLEAEFGEDVILDTWTELDAPDGRTAIEVIEDVIENNGSTLQETLPRFYTAAYMLENDPDDSMPEFDDDDIATWRAILDNPGPQFGEVDGDSFSDRGRLGRANIGESSHEGKIIDVPGGGGEVGVGTYLKPGGAAILDVRIPDGYRGDLHYRAISPTNRYDKYVATFIVWAAGSDPASDSGYPKVCQRNGAPVIQTDPLPSDSGLSAFAQLDESCPTGSIILTMIDPESTDPGDDVFFTFDLENSEPVDPPDVEATATIDGPGVTGMGSGQAVGIVSDPPSAGPSGALCVDVTVYATWWLFNAAVEIEVFDPFTGFVVEKVDWPQGVIESSPKTFNLGPETRNPWTPMAVRVTETSPELITWSAHPTSC